MDEETQMIPDTQPIPNTQLDSDSQEVVAIHVANESLEAGPSSQPIWPGASSDHEPFSLPISTTGPSSQPMSPGASSDLKVVTYRS